MLKTFLKVTKVREVEGGVIKDVENVLRVEMIQG